jgi:hypothetical protein
MKKFLKTKKFFEVWFEGALGGAATSKIGRKFEILKLEKKKTAKFGFHLKIKMRKFQFLFQPLMNVFCCCCYYCHFCLPYSLDRQMNRILVSANESIPVSANESNLVSANESNLVSANESNPVSANESILASANKLFLAS